MKDRSRHAAALLALLLPALLAAQEPPPAEPDETTETITGKVHHIGNNEKPEWKDFTTVEAEHPYHLRVLFDVKKTIDKVTFEVRAGGVGDDWRVKVNGKTLGNLKKGETATTQYLEASPDLVKPTGNELLIEAVKERIEDDVFIGPVVLHHRPKKDLLKLATVRVTVTDPEGNPLPCRLTIARVRTPQKKDEKEEELTEVVAEEEKSKAIRRGVIYTQDGKSRFQVSAGRYRVYATRGFEYGLARAELSLAPDERKAVELVLEREVDTAGWLAADTHLHTKTYSKHGDATLEERLVTIAGEGVEVAIATDHNHHTDYRPEARKMGLQDRFFSVVGNEFTTVIGHFNAFPIQKDAKPAPHTSKSWTKLLAAIRATPGVEVVICNHPRRGKPDENSFSNIGLNPLTGESHRGPDSLGIDAIEVLNGKGLHDPSLVTFRDWFALLNRGTRVSAVAGSDSHTVEGIVGQSRTYIRSPTDDPREVKIEDITSSFLKGRLLLSLGLLARARVDGRFEVGDLAGGLREEMEVDVEVVGPRWARADQVTLYLNGQPVKEARIEACDGVVKLRETWRIARPPHDAHLVVIATGPPITAPYWSLPQEKKYLMGATNPIWLDADGDGRFTTAREYASRILSGGRDSTRVQAALAAHDAAVVFQAASILRGEVQAELQMEYERLIAAAQKRLDGALASGNTLVAARFQEYVKETPLLDVLSRTEVHERRLQEEKEREEEEKARKKKEEEERKKAEEERKKAEEKAKKKARPQKRL